MWPFKRKPKTTESALEQWHREFDAWLDKLQEVAAEFPDHTSLANTTPSERVARILDEISDVYGEDYREVLERFVLRSEALRRARQGM